MPKYFVMTDKGQTGPYDLSQLTEIGLRPSTYVWTKGMSDWQKAEEIPEICQLFRYYVEKSISKNSPEVESATLNHSSEEDGESFFSRSQEEDRNSRSNSGFFLRSFTADDNPTENFDLNTTPPNLLPVAILTAIICFPISGLVAIYFAYRIRKLWRESDNDDIDSSQRDALRRKSYDSLRLAKMWIGYTISLGLIFSAITLFKGL